MKKIFTYKKTSAFSILLSLLFIVVLTMVSDHTTNNNDAQSTPSSATQKKIPPPRPQVATSSLSASQLPLSTLLTREGPYAVVRDVDGDTVVVNVNGKNETIRLIGVDTPESVDPRKPVQCFGKEASAFTDGLLWGSAVYLVRDPSQDNRDKYGRLLRYVLLPDGSNVDFLLIFEGYGHEYTYHVPYAYQKEFKAAQAQAREQSRGLWGEKCIPIVSTLY